MKKLNIFNKKSTGWGKLSTLLAAFILLLIVTSSTSARADGGYDFVIDNLGYNINEDGKTVTLVRYDGDEPSGELIIPATVTNGDKEYSVTAIGDNAFNSCTSLTSVTIPESVTSIGERAFTNCYSLTSLTIPEGVTSIGEDAFFGVRHIINKSNCTDPDHWGAFVENGTVDGDFVYENDTKAKLLLYIGKGGDITIPESVTAIGDKAFFNCKSLTSVTIPESVTSIGKSAFFNCTSLTSVTIPESVTSIGKSAFSSCSSLTSVTIPKSVTSIGMMAFLEVRHIINKSECRDPDHVHWGAFVENGTVDGDFIYEDDTKTNLLIYIGKGGEVTIPDGVTAIGNKAFIGCESLTSVTIPESVTSIGDYAFIVCSSVENVYLYANPDNLTWSENGCDDFITNPRGATQCHVLAEYLDKYATTKFRHVNVTFVGDVTLLTADDITTSQISDVTYTGTPFTPEIEVKYGNKTLEAGTDYTITYTNNINAGTAKATITGITNLCIGSRDIEFTIAPAPVTVTAENKTKAFGESDPEFTATVSGLVNNESADLIKYTLTRTEGENVGEYTITPKGDEKQGNYVVSFVDGIFTINPVPVTVSAEAKSKTFGESDPEFTAIVTGLVNNESADLIKYTITRKEGENVGEYTITPKGDEKQGNYAVSFVDATLTITKATPNPEPQPNPEPEPEPQPEPDPQNPSTPVSSIDNGGNNVKVWSYARTIYIASTPDSQYKIIDLQGRTIATSTTTSSLEQININKSGILVVIINGKSYKVSL